MNQDLKQVITYYAIKTHKELNSLLLDKSKDNLISIIVDLLTTYINDKNSSTLREFITVSIAGYKHSEKKIGYNGYKQSTIANTKRIPCEAKPKNFDTKALDEFKNGKRRTNPTKLNGGGNFSDYTFKRLERDKSENPNILVSGFVNGKLIYILEFPFNNKIFIEALEMQLERRLPNGDKQGEYLRSASFDYSKFIESKDLKIIYLQKTELKTCEEFINKKFYKNLLKLAIN